MQRRKDSDALMRWSHIGATHSQKCVAPVAPLTYVRGSDDSDFAVSLHLTPRITLLFLK